jgi:type IV secretion system pilin
MPSRRERTLSTAPARKRFALGLVAAGAVVLLVAAAAPAMAQAEAPSLAAVIDRLRNLLVGVLAAAATLFLTIGGLRYMAAGGDPGQVERAKVALRAAAVGYVLAALAPVIVTILRSVVGQ